MATDGTDTVVTLTIGGAVNAGDTITAVLNMNNPNCATLTSSMLKTEFWRSSRLQF